MKMLKFISLIILSIYFPINVVADVVVSAKNTRILNFVFACKRYSMAHEGQMPKTWNSLNEVIHIDNPDFAFLRNDFAIVKIPSKGEKPDNTCFVSTGVTKKNGLTGRYMVTANDEGMASYDFRSNEEIGQLGITLPPPQKSAEPTSANPSTPAETHVGPLSKAEGTAANPTTQSNPTNQLSQTAAITLQPQPSSSFPLVVGILLLLAVVSFVIYRRKP